MTGERIVREAMTSRGSAGVNSVERGPRCRTSRDAAHVPRMFRRGAPSWRPSTGSARQRSS
jgi:hypothetical protein